MLIQSVQKQAQKTNATNFKSKSFEIGDASMVIEILRKKLYSNPIQTLVQEYISNARDANREAGSKRPIDITLPTSDNLTLSIRDFGKGLSPERVAEVFVKYGNSTKRSSNSETGGFGIGAKSAWAYTDSFTVVTHVDGTAYHYIAHVTKEQAGSLDLISEMPTAEPNGTEIQIAIQAKDLRDFMNAVVRATELWDTKEFPKFEDDSIERANSVDRIGRLEIIAGESDTIHVVVDGIPYPMPEEFFKTKDDALESLQNLVKTRTLLHFKTGEIEVSASREAITNNDANQKAVIEAARQAVTDIKAMLKREIQSQKTLIAALHKHGTLSHYYNLPYDSAFKLKATGGDTFVLNKRGGLTSELFNGLQIRKYSTSDGYRARGKLMIRSEDPSSIDFTSARVFYTDDETSHANQNRRVKNTIGSGEAFIIMGDIHSPTLTRLAVHLGIKPTSSLGPSSIRKNLTKETSGDIILNQYVKPTSKQTVAKVVSLDRNDTVYVYAVRKSDSDANSQYKQLNALLMACGLSFTLITQATADKVKGNPKFVSFAEFRKSFRKWVPKTKQSAFLQTLKAVVLQRNCYGTDHNTKLYGQIAEHSLKDKSLAVALKTLATYDSDKVLKNPYEHYRLDRELTKSDSSLKVLIQSTPELNEYAKQETNVLAFKKKYVLLGAVEYEKNDGRKTAPDLVTYLNASYRKAA